MQKHLVFPTLACVALFFISGCGQNTAVNPESGSANLARGCVERFDPTRDYFPKKAQLEFAKNFSVEYHNSYKVVTVHEAAQQGGPETYVLAQCGAPKPSLDGKLASAQVVSVPIVSLFAESTTQFQPLIDLGRIDVLTGVAGAQYAVQQEALDRIRDGKVVDFAAAGTINAERVIAAAPTLLMASRNDDPLFVPIRNGGVPVVSNAEWLEQSGLGRAEWIKFIALFLNEEDRAERRFAEIRSSYEAWAARTADIPKERRPKVTTGGIFRGNYMVAGGNSYAASLIKDAGGNYVFADNDQTGSPTFDIESGIARASAADYWINGSPSWTSLQSMLSDESRYQDFKAFRMGQVWLYNRKLRADGTNEYWAKGVSRPDLILADMIKIFHPDLAKDHEFQWYVQLPERVP
jgi:iron complex transport system substrate-binding protein